MKYVMLYFFLIYPGYAVKLTVKQDLAKTTPTVVPYGRHGLNV